MKRTVMLLRVLMVIVPVMGLAGHCGSAAINAVSSASGQVTAAVYVQQWSQILWGVVSNQTGTQEPSFSDPVENPDGSWTWTLTAADGTYASVTNYADGTARMDLVLPNGTTQTVTQSADRGDGWAIIITDWTLTSSDGLSVQYTSTTDLGEVEEYDQADDTVDLVGSSILPKGITQTFEVHTIPNLTSVRSVQSDGSTFTLEVPLTDIDFLPDYSRNATGTYVSRAFNIAFTLTHIEDNPNLWSVVLSRLGPKLTGEFSLNGDFSGYGQLIETLSRGRRKLSAVVSWKQYGESQVYPLSGRRSQTRPAGAALAYLQHRWQTLAALMGPAPGL